MNQEIAVELINAILKLKNNEDLKTWTDKHLAELDETFFQVLENVISKNSKGNPSLTKYLSQIIHILKEAKLKRAVDLVNQILEFEKEEELENWIKEYTSELDNIFFDILNAGIKDMLNKNVPLPYSLKRVASLKKVVFNNSLKTVHIIGAGFSHSAGFPLCADLLNELDRFMETEYEIVYKQFYGNDVRFLSFTYMTWKPIRDELINSKLFIKCVSLDPEGFLLGNIEEVLDVVDNELMLFSSNEESDPFFTPMTLWRFGFINCLAFFFRWKCLQFNKKDYKPIEFILSYIMNFVKPGDTIINFNYDNIIEHILYNARSTNPNTAIVWTRGDGYGFHNPKFNISVEAKHANKFPGGIGMEDEDYISINEKMGSNVKLLYLHGSAFWTWDSLKSRLMYDAHLLCSKFEFAEKEIIDLVRPLLAEPRKKKPLHIGVLSDIWKAAEDSMKNAEQIVIIGYSFPAADGAAERMIKHALENTDSEITVIDPAPRSTHRIVKLFGERVMYISETLDEFTKQFLDAAIIANQ